MSKDDTQYALVPRLRFPEFRGAPLREVQLYDVTEECTTRNGDTLPPESVMGVRKGGGIVPMEERLIGADISRYKLVQRNWFAYNPMRLNIGSIARWSGDSDILVSPDYVVFRCLEDANKGIDPAYLDHFRESDRWEDFVSESGIGSVRVRIYFKDIGRLRLRLPTLPEQRKIAACLGSLDDLIAAEGRKLAALRRHKKGLMQQLFPREGETRPRLRFPEFQDGPEWKEEKLGTHVEIKSGSSPSQFALLSGGRYPFVKVEDLNNSTKYQVTSREFCDDGEGVVPRNSLVFPKRGAAIELNKIRITGTEILIDTNLMAITPTDRLDSEFLFYYISNVGLAHIADTSTIPQINNKHIIPFGFLFPFTDEQLKIADCLASLDTIITAQAEKLDALRTHKGGLMQQLFPSPGSEYRDG